MEIRYELDLHNKIHDINYVKSWAGISCSGLGSVVAVWLNSLLIGPVGQIIIHYSIFMQTLEYVKSINCLRCEK